jgi:hypothetical protein
VINLKTQHTVKLTHINQISEILAVVKQFLRKFKEKIFMGMTDRQREGKTN